MKQTMFLIIILFMLPSSCKSDDLVFTVKNNIGVKDFISCDKEKNSSIRDSRVYPEYNIILTKKKPNVVKKLEIDLSYYYGTNMDFITKTLWVLSEVELNELNENNSVERLFNFLDVEREEYFIVKNNNELIDEEEYLTYMYTYFVVSK